MAVHVSGDTRLLTRVAGGGEAGQRVPVGTTRTPERIELLAGVVAGGAHPLESARSASFGIEVRREVLRD